MDAVVVEFDSLDYGLSAGGRDVVDKGDDAFPPLLDVDLFGIGARLHRRLRRRLSVLDRIGIEFGFDREAVIGAQPEADLDDIRSWRASRDFRIGDAGEDRLGFGDRGVGAFAPERRLRRVHQNLQNAEQGFVVIGLSLKHLAELRREG